MNKHSKSKNHDKFHYIKQNYVMNAMSKDKRQNKEKYLDISQKAYLLNENNFLKNLDQ